MGSKIVVIEDDPDIRDVLRYNLDREGFTVVHAANGEEGLRAVQREKPDLVLLDLLLPGVNGLEVCRLLKLRPETREVPIIMVTAKGEESDIVLGLGLGADDYATKPFSPKELIARIRAVLRRAQAPPPPEGDRAVELDGLAIDPSRHEVRVEGRVVPLTATEFRLLHCLASSPGRVFTREQLVQRAIGERVTVIDRNIDVHVRAIRKKLGSDHEWIETLRGVGYRFRDASSV